MKTPERSEGARAERKAMRAYLRRRLRTDNGWINKVVYEDILAWVLTREKRYGKKSGGL